MVEQLADFTVKLLREGIVEGNYGFLPNFELKSLIEKAEAFGRNGQIINSLKEWFALSLGREMAQQADHRHYITKDVLEDLEVFLSFHQMKGTIGKLLFELNGQNYSLNTN